MGVVIVRAKMDKTSLNLGLTEHGLTRFPGTRVLIPLSKRGDRYITGIDENDPDLDNIQDDKQRSKEKEVLSKKRIRLAQELGLKPAELEATNAEFWDKQSIKLGDGENYVDKGTPQGEIQYAWLLKTGKIARNEIEAMRNPDFEWFIEDESVEVEISFKLKKFINKASKVLDELSIEKQRKIGRLLEQPISELSTEEQAFSVLDTFIKDEKRPENSQKFLDTVAMNDELSEAKLLIKDAIRHGVFKKDLKTKLIRFGSDNKIESDWEDFLVDPMNQADLIAVQHRIKEERLKKS